MVIDAVPGKEEYFNSEKYQISHWDWKYENKLSRLITKMNMIRKQQPALQQTNNIEFCELHHDALMAYYKWDQDRNNELLIVVSLDPYYKQSGHLRLPYEKMNLAPGSQVVVKDLITDSTYTWNQEWNYVELHPALPVHIFQIYK